MKRKRHTPEQIISLLRDAEADLAAGLNIEQVCQRLGVSQQTVRAANEPESKHRFARKSAGRASTAAPKNASMKRLKELEAENKRLKKAVAELTLEKQILKEVPRGLRSNRSRAKQRVARKTNPSTAQSGRKARAAHAGVIGNTLMQHGPPVPQYAGLRTAQAVK